MLQRAARNAYSWWWASHVRTKQSKWLEDNLQDMEEKVEYIIKVIDEDGDTFAQRAEMYYRKRPEIVNFVEDFFRGYRALADRFDHLSRELQSANRTIATVFPETVDLRMEDSDEFDNENLTDQMMFPSSGIRNNNKITKNAPAAPQLEKIPKLFPSFKKSKMPTRLMSKKGLMKFDAKKVSVIQPKSGLQKTEALQRIDELQKGILALQTEKEFVKYSYEKGIERYREIEKQITEMQEVVGNLQDEFGIGTVFEDNEARSIMTKAALRSCQETLTRLQHKQEQSSEEAREELQKIENAQEKLKNITSNQDIESSSIKQVGSTGHNVRDLDSLHRKMNEDLRISTGDSLTVSEHAEKVDELVGKIIKLEASVTSHSAFVQRLKLETKDLTTNLQSLEVERENSIERENMSNKITELIGELQKVKSLSHRMNGQDYLLQTGFAEASCNIEDLSKKLQNVKPDEEAEINTLSLSQAPDVNTSEMLQLQSSVHDMNIMPYPVLSSNNEMAAKTVGDENASYGDTINGSAVRDDSAHQKEVKEHSPCSRTLGENDDIDRLFVTGQQHGTGYIRDTQIVNAQKVLDEKEDEVALSNIQIENDSKKPTSFCKDRDETVIEDSPNWKKLFSSNIDDRARILLDEYTSILSNYKEAKKKLSEVEKNKRASLFRYCIQIKVLESSNALKDAEIQSLQKKLSLFQDNQNVTNEFNAPDEQSLQIHQNAHGDLPYEETDESEHVIEDRSDLQQRKVSSMEEDGRANAPSTDEISSSSVVEERIRADIDELLDENIDFWMKFSSSLHQIQKFTTAVHDLQAEIAKVMESKKIQNTNTNHQTLITDIRPMYRHLSEIQTELTLWLDQNAVLKEDLHNRSSSLSSIQEEINRMSNADSILEFSRSNDYQAAKYKGEVMNMKQENNRVVSELHSALERVRNLQVEIDKTLTEVDEEFGISTRRQSRYAAVQTKIPLRSFLFGVKLKKRKPSLFACMNPNFQRKYSDLSSLPA